MDQKINIVLTKDEALVLFDFLGRFNAQEHINIFEDQAEQRILWDIEAQMEQALVDPLKPNYTDLVMEARDKVRDKE